MARRGGAATKIFSPRLAGGGARHKRGLRLCGGDAPGRATTRLIVAQTSRSAVVRRKPGGLRYNAGLLVIRIEPAPPGKVLKLLPEGAQDAQVISGRFNFFKPFI